MRYTIPLVIVVTLIAYTLRLWLSSRITCSREILFPEFGDRADRVYCGDGSKLDFAGHPVEYLVDYEEFLEKFVGRERLKCHHFVDWGFLYDEEGVYGFADTLVGFKTREDRDSYWCYVKQNDIV